MMNRDVPVMCQEYQIYPISIRKAAWQPGRINPKAIKLNGGKQLRHKCGKFSTSQPYELIALTIILAREKKVALS